MTYQEDPKLGYLGYDLGRGLPSISERNSINLVENSNNSMQLPRFSGSEDMRQSS